MSVLLNKRGFTLVELLMVIAIIAIMAAISTPRFLSYKIDADTKTCQSNQASLETALEQYAYSYNSYPSASKQDSLVNIGIIKVVLICPSMNNEIAWSTDGKAFCPNIDIYPKHLRPSANT